jgi:hypothetical protein
LNVYKPLFLEPLTAATLFFGVGEGQVGEL